MQVHTIELPDHVNDYVLQRLDGHLENLDEYVVSLIEEEHKKQQAKLELKALLSEPSVSTPSALTLSDIKARALTKVQNGAL
ncbi:MAG: hypothetical protein ACP5D0_10315 [Hydrogenovibrio sp.]